MKTEFNFAIGRPHDINNPEGHVSFYACHGTNHFGTIEEAQGFRDHCNRMEESELRRAGKVDKRGQVIREQGPYRIYKLVEIGE